MILSIRNIFLDTVIFKSLFYFWFFVNKYLLRDIFNTKYEVKCHLSFVDVLIKYRNRFGYVLEVDTSCRKLSLFLSKWDTPYTIGIFEFYTR